jgi:uncharacterized delta-60 repeat protein
MKTITCLEDFTVKAMACGGLALSILTASVGAFVGNGSGSVSDPYQIGTAAQLQEMSADLSAHYVLMNDVDAANTATWNGGAGFVPVGSVSAPFTGSLDGRGHAIRNLTISRGGAQNIALFGCTGTDSAVENVSMDQAAITSMDWVGTLAGRNHGSMRNCYATGTVSGSGSFGGLVGSNFGLMEHCSAAVTVGGGNHLGGLAGVNSGTIRDCFVTGDVSGNEDPGGMVGVNGGMIENCHSRGNVTTQFGWNPAYARGAGGLVGINASGTIRGCFATGNVSGPDARSLGGLVGVNKTEIGESVPVIENCYYNHTTGNPPVGLGQNPAGGAVGITAIENDESYFFNHANPPENTWDFTRIWGFPGDVTGVAFPGFRVAYQVNEIVVEDAAGTDLPDGVATIDFGSVMVGSTSAAKTFTIINRGTADLAGLAITTDGSHPGDFTVGALGATALTPGANTTFTVAFTPTALRSRGATLQLVSNDFDENPFEIALTGTGTSDIVLDPGFNPNANSYLLSTAVQPDGKIVIGGVFSTVGGAAHNLIARIHADGSLDPSFNPAVAGSQIHSIAVQADGKVLIAGYFSSVGGAARSDFARLNADGTLDTGFNPNTDSWPSCITVQGDGKIIIGGYFSNVGGAAHNKIARLNPDATPDTGFNPAANGTVYSATVQDDGKIVIVGAFGSVNGTARPHVARLNADGTLDASFNPGANGPVYISALQADGKIVISGSFSTVGGTTRNQIARLNADGTVDSGFDPNMGAAAETAVVQADGKILIGGSFTTVGGTARRYLARLNANGTLDNSFEPNVNNLVYSTELLADGTILFGGRFTSVDGTTRNHIARLLNSPATQTLTVASPARVEWQRGGTSPETTQVSFELSTDGTTWTMLGTGTRISGGWELTGLSLPANGTLRAYARTGGGYRTGSSGLVESLQSFTFNTPPIADAGADQAIQLGSTAYLDGTSSTDDDTPASGLVYAWTIESAPAGSTADLSGADTFTPALVPDLAGDYTMKLTVTDVGGLQDTDETKVSATAVFINGSFEDDFLGWAANGTVSLQSGGGMYHPTDGAKLIAFNALNSTPGGELSQVFPTIAGQAYRLEFDVGVLAYNRDQQRLGVTVRGARELLVDAIPLTGLGGGKILWVPKSYVFTADSATTTLTFRDLSTATIALDLLLDHVRVTPLVTTLLVISTPANGVGMTLNPPDTLGAGDGATSFRRFYNPGSVADLTAPAEAGGSGFCHWLKDGFPFSADPAVQVIMDGDHQMTAVYADGPPLIITPPIDTVAVVGGEAVFSVIASGKAPLFYQWRVNGMEIPGATDRDLTIMPVEQEDVGNYDVVVSNSLGFVTSDPAALTLQPAFVGLENGCFEHYFEGWTVSGNVWVQAGPPPQGNKVAAFNAGNTVPNGVLSQTFATTPGQAYELTFDMGVLAYNTYQQRLEVRMDGNTRLLSETFIITGLGGGKTRWITPSLSFTADSTRTTLTFLDGSATSISLDLLLDCVRVVPRITRTLVVESWMPGLNELPVAVSPPDDSGDADGVTRFSRHYLDSTVVSLTAPAEFRGFYGPGIAPVYQFEKWLKAGVEFGTHPAASVTLDGNCTLTAVYRVKPPVITDQPDDVIVGVGGTATFHVTVADVTVLTSYQWRFNGTDLPGATTDSLVIGPVEANDAGSYDVLVSNPGGSVVSDPAGLTIVPNDLVNGGFESDTQGWNASGNLGIRTTAPYAPSEGLRLVAFNAGNSTPNGILSQTFATTPGITYLLSFDMGVLAYNTAEQRLQVDLSGSPAFRSETYSMRGIGGGKTVWETKNITFTADSSATTVTFRDASAPVTVALDLLLDHVRLEEVPTEFSLIPAGSFQMGDSFAEGGSDELPVHTVNISAFYMAKHEVTQALWNEVKTWGASHGYTDLPAGGSEAADHPAGAWVSSFRWYAIVKWCNARSEKDGLTPCYTVSGAVYRTGVSEPVCDWSANGYRLPTEAEWEKAARGGLGGKRFPWGDTISHSDANYGSGNASPVGSFAANGYGLHDMAGNVWEWCWDWYSDSYYASSPPSDPQGAASGSYRVLRGGAFLPEAYYCRVACRKLDIHGPDFGFRLARSSVP